MKPIKIKPGSWHYDLAVRYPQLSWYATQELNTCSYVRRVALGIFACLAIVTVAAGLLAPWVDMLAWVLAGRPPGAPRLFEFWTAEALIMTALLISFGAYHLFHWVGRKWRDLPPSEPGELNQLFNAWHGKYCLPVEVGEREQ